MLNFLFFTIIYLSTRGCNIIYIIIEYASYIVLLLSELVNVVLVLASTTSINTTLVAILASIYSRPRFGSWKTNF